MIHRTATHDSTDLSGADSSEPSKELIVAAAVVVIDSSGVRVPARGLDQALQMIRSRHHKATPIVELANSSTTTGGLFEQGTWEITSTGTRALSSHAVRRRPAGYRLEYTDFTVIVPGEGSVQTKNQTLTSVVAAAQNLADRGQTTITLTSQLLGFTPTVLRADPTRAPAHPADRETAADGATIDQDSGDQQSALESDTPTLQMTATGTDLLDLPAEPIPSPPRTPARPRRHRSHPFAGTLAAVRSRMRRLNRPQLNLARAAALVHPNRKRLAIVAAAVAAGLAVAITGTVVQHDRGAAQPQPAVLSTAPAITDTGTDLLAGYDTELWTLAANRAAALSWFGAGVAYVDPDNGDFVLLDHRSGETIAQTGLDSAVEYTAEFRAGDVPAVGARTAAGFTALNADGRTQTWSLADGETLRVSGSTPMVTTPTGEIFALLFDHEERVSVTGNPQYQPVAIDGETLIGIAPTAPRLVTIPRGDTSTASEIELPVPMDGAAFDRHLTVGHGLALAVWTHDSQSILAVHDLDQAGAVTAALPAPPAPQPWSMGRGMQIAITGPYAIDLATGQLIAQSPTGDYASALGPAVVSDTHDGRTFLHNGKSYTETTRVIGYSGTGTALVRNPDGSVTALENTGETE